jgi:hypothetical protein
MMWISWQKVENLKKKWKCSSIADTFCDHAEELIILSLCLTTKRTSLKISIESPRRKRRWDRVWTGIRVY